MTHHAGGLRRALLVGDPSGRTALSGARALDRAGWEVHLAGYGGPGLAGRSRSVRALHAVRPPEAAGYPDDLARLARRLPGTVVLACGDAELLALSRAGADLDGLLGLPGAEAVATLVDKSRLAVAAGDVGLAVPGRAEDPPRAWPVVVKAAVHHAPGRATSRWEVSVAADAVALAAAHARARSAGVDVVVQEHVPGELLALCLVLDASGRVVGRSQQVAERIWPQGAGVSARAVTVPVEEDLAERCAALLRGAGWRGLAQLQLLRQSGRAPVLIDVNPRLYGSLRLAVAAGAPLPHLAAQVLSGQDVARQPDARPGVRYQWFLGDLRAGLAAGGSRTRAVLATVGAARGAVGAVRDRRDPVPAAAAAAELLVRAGRRLR